MQNPFQLIRGNGTGHRHTNTVCFCSLAVVTLALCMVASQALAQADTKPANGSADNAKTTETADGKDASETAATDSSNGPPKAAANASASTETDNETDSGQDSGQDSGKQTGKEPSNNPGATPRIKDGKLQKLTFPETKSASALDLNDLAAQLPAVLRALAQPRNPQAHKVARKLDALARESSDLAKLLPSPTGKLRARHLELQAYNALANRAQQSRQVREASYRVSQIRSAALGTRDLDMPQAHALADFWLLQADLFDINRSDATIPVRQRRAIQRLERFLIEREALANRNAPKIDTATKKANVVGDRLNAQVELALLRLYDQQGLNDKAQAIVKKFGKSTLLTDVQRKQVAEDYAYLQTLGQFFQANLALSNGKPWSSRSHRGQAIVIVLYADSDNASQGAHERIKAISASLQVRGIATLSVKVQRPASASPVKANDAVADATTIDSWPVYEEAKGRVHLSRMFAVRSLPRYVLIDTQGKIHAIAGSDAVLKRLKEIQPAKPGPLKDR